MDEMKRAAGLLSKDTPLPVTHRPNDAVAHHSNDGPWIILLPDSPRLLELNSDLRGEVDPRVVSVWPPPVPPPPPLPGLAAGLASARKQPVRVVEMWDSSNLTCQGIKGPGGISQEQPRVAVAKGEPQIIEPRFRLDAAETRQPGHEPPGIAPETIEAIVKASHERALLPFQLPVTRLFLTQTPHWEKTTAEPRNPRVQRQAMVEDVPESSEPERDGGSERSKKETPPPKLETPEPQDTSTNDRAYDAKKRQAARSERIREIQRDKALVEESNWERKKKEEKKDTHRFLLLKPDDGPSSGSQKSTTQTEQEQAWKRGTERRQKREERERERQRRNESRGKTADLDRMDLYWFCQVDMYQGFWAIPWSVNTPHQA